MSEALLCDRRGLDARPSETVSTGVPGLYVAGDARTGSLGQVGMAVGDGLAAAMAACATLEAKISA